MIKNKINLEEANKNGYMMYRVPGIITTPKGTLIIYYEARMGRGDWTKQDIIMRRSNDNGETWSKREYLIKGNDSTTLHNTVFFSDTKKNCIHVLYNENYNKCYYMNSYDDGYTWSKKCDITNVFCQFSKEYDWNVIAVGPGHGIQLENGRLIVPVWLSTGGKSHRPSVISNIYSDDHGKTWERGEIIFSDEVLINPNETTAVELANNSVLMNIRHEGHHPYRAFSISKNGSTEWSKIRYDNALPDPICFGSLVRVKQKKKDGQNMIAFSNCAYTDPEGRKNRLKGISLWSSKARQNLCIKISYDECITWIDEYLVEKEAGYSDIATTLDKKKIICVYEREWFSNDCCCIKYIAVALLDI